MAASSPAKSKTATKTSAVATKKTWKRKKGEELLLPSGNVAVVKRPGPAVFLTQGLLPDTLTPIVNDSIRNGQGLPPEKVKDLSESPEGIVSMLDAMDRVLVAVVLEPRVTYHRRPVLDSDGNPAIDDKGKETYEDIPENERDEDEIYSDDVDLEDKMFVFNFAVGGTRDLERFREEHSTAMGDIRSLETGEDQPE